MTEHKGSGAFELLLLRRDAHLKDDVMRVPGKVSYLRQFITGSISSAAGLRTFQLHSSQSDVESVRDFNFLFGSDAAWYHRGLHRER